MQEAASGAFSAVALQRLLRHQASLFDRLIATVTDEHKREWERRPNSTEQRRLKRVEGLLDGELVESEELGYDLDRWHLGLIVRGPGGAAAVRDLARALDSRLLLVHWDEATAWAWLGLTLEGDSEQVLRRLASTSPPELRIALGEPALGLPGWRLTHRQATASMSVAMRHGHGVTRYADVALLAAILADEVFAASLRELFLAPLTAEGERGAVLRKTLRAYFKAVRNVSSAAAALAVSRQTVINRLRAVEELLGRPLGACALELEAALRLDAFENPPLPAAAMEQAPGPLQTDKPARMSLDTLPTHPTATA